MDKNIRVNVIVPVWLRDAAHNKAQADAADLSRVIRRLLWAYVSGVLNPYRLPDPPDQPPG